MVKKLSLAKSTQELEEKAENVRIDEKADEATLLRYIKSANTVFTNAESVFQKGDEEQAYIYFVKFFHVYSQLRSTIAYINKNKAVLNEMSSLLPISKCKTALSRAEKLKKSLSARYSQREAAELKEQEEKQEKQRLEEERDRQLAEIERLKLEAAQPSVDAATLFSNTVFSTPLVPMGHSAKDTIPKEPYISAIELMHIIEAKMKVLLIDVRSLDEFKNSHVIHEAVIFLSKDYLDISTKLTNSEIRELILMKDHKLLWDKRGMYDVIVIFDSDSQYNSVAELSNSPINIVRECTTDCLDPNFINSDLPKVLDGGYASWVYHFPKHCTNPDRARKLKPVAKTRRSAPASLLPLTPAKAAAIYPELNKETEPKPLPPAVLSSEEPAPAASVVTCGNVQISMPQSPQTIQINQWNQEQHVLPRQAVPCPSAPRSALPSVPKHMAPDPSLRSADLHPRAQQSVPDLRPKQPVTEQRAPTIPLESNHPEPPVKPSKSDGSLRITDIYEESPSPTPSTSTSSSHSSANSQQTIREDVITTFPTKGLQPAAPPQSKDPVYAQVEVRRKVPSHAVVSSNSVAPKTAEYADIRAIQPAVERPTIDRSSKPREPPVQTVQPAARNRVPVDLTKPPAYITQPQLNQPEPSNNQTPLPHNPPKQPSNQTPSHNLIQPTVPQPQQPRPLPQPSKPQSPQQAQSPRQQPAQPTARSTRSQPTPPVKNPTINRVVKPLSAKALEEKNMRMMPAYGSVQMGTCGLKNIGNTCFMNAVLQCLSAIAPLTKYFVSGQYKHEINAENPLGTKGLVAEEYAFLVRAMWSDRFRHLAPKDWKEAIGRFRPQFLDYSQKDSQEFTSFMLDALHEDLNRVQLSERKRLPEIDYSKMSYKEGARAAWDCYRARNDSVVVDLFQGQFRNVTHCLRCGYESVTFDTFMYLTVPVGKSRTSLHSCIENFCQEEKIEWRCDKCKVLGDATKSITIWRLPTILVVILKRFSYSGMWRDKISTFVDFPLSNFRAVAREVSWISNPEEGRVFRLFGVTNHTGTLEGGHYIGCARNPLSGDWFTYDDHVIRPMRAEQTKKKEAYLLFYTSLGEQDDLRQLNFAR